MKKLFMYVLFMIITVIFIPLIIVRGCSYQDVEVRTEMKRIAPSNTNIIVYISQEDKTIELGLEEYLVGVVAAEMPANFEIEALKAQSIAARTYAYGRMQGIYIPKDNPHPQAHICTDSTHCQAWISEEEAKERWGWISSGKNWNKIKKAVSDTTDIIILHEGQIVNPVFHASSGGLTENAEKVWSGVAVPYLKSVESFEDEQRSGYRYEKIIKVDEFVKILKNKFGKFETYNKDVYEDIKILDRSSTGRVLNIRVGSAEMKGTEFRSIFSLRSTNFEIEKINKDELKIITFGHGHGVGMSQWGANYLAKNGGSYEEILKHYYTGIELSKID